MEILVTVLTLIVIGLSYGCYNLLRKTELYEDTLEKYQKGFEELNLTILGNLEYVKKLDAEGHFESDDELGAFFEAMKDATGIIAKVFTEIDNKDAQKKE